MKYTVYYNDTEIVVSQWDILPKLIEIVTDRFETLGCNYLKVIREVGIIADSLRDDLVKNGNIEYHGVVIEKCD